MNKKTARVIYTLLLTLISTPQALHAAVQRETEYIAGGFILMTDATVWRESNMMYITDDAAQIVSGAFNEVFILKNDGSL